MRQSIPACKVTKKIHFLVENKLVVYLIATNNYQIIKKRIFTNCNNDSKINFFVDNLKKSIRQLDLLALLIEKTVKFSLNTADYKLRLN